jgi:hypothetical protein
MVYHHHLCLRVERDDFLSASCFLRLCTECRRQIKTVSIRVHRISSASSTTYVAHRIKNRVSHRIYSRQRERVGAPAAAASAPASGDGGSSISWDAPGDGRSSMSKVPPSGSS